MALKTEIIDFNVTDAAITELSSQYMPLIVNGLEDKNGLVAVNNARKIIKRYRIDVDKRRKELNADALDYQRRINGEAKRIIALLEPIEDHLAAEEQKIADELERIKKEKEAAEDARYQIRIARILDIGFKFDGVKYVTDYIDTFNNEIISTTVLHLKQIDDAVFNDFYENAKHYHDIAKKEAIESLAKQEAERKAEQERLIQREKELELERERLADIARTQAEKDASLKVESDRIESLKKYEESKMALIECEASHEGKTCYEAGLSNASPSPTTDVEPISNEFSVVISGKFMVNGIYYTKTNQEAIDAALSDLRNEKFDVLTPVFDTDFMQADLYIKDKVMNLRTSNK